MVNGNPVYKVLDWALGVPGTNAGDLKTVSEWRGGLRGPRRLEQPPVLRDPHRDGEPRHRAEDPALDLDLAVRLRR